MHPGKHTLTRVHSPAAVQRCRKLRQWLLVLWVGGGSVFWIMITLVTLSECKNCIKCVRTSETYAASGKETLVARECVCVCLSVFECMCMCFFGRKWVCRHTVTNKSRQKQKKQIKEWDDVAAAQNTVAVARCPRGEDPRFRQLILIKSSVLKSKMCV